MLEYWKEYFPPRILERGKSYWREGRVRLTDVDAEHADAEVDGSETYYVSIDFGKRGNIEGMFCSCPYADDGNSCKHMAAVLFELFEGEYEPESGEEMLQAEIEEAVESLPAEKLRELLLAEAKKNTSLQAKILRACGKKDAEIQTRQYEKEIHAITRRFADSDGFIDYMRAYEYTEELGAYLYDTASSLIESDEIMEAFQLTNLVFDEVLQCEMDDSDGGEAELFSLCDSLWAALYESADLEQRQEMYEWFMKRAEQELPYGAEDWIMSCVLEHFTDEEFQFSNLRLLDDKIEEADEYELEPLVEQRLRLMIRMGASAAAVSAYMDKYRALHIVREIQLKAYLSRGENKKAIQLLREGMEQDKGKPGLQREASERLIKLYQEENMREDCKKELLHHISSFRQTDLSFVRMLKGLTDSGEWPAVREKLSRLPSLSWVVYELLGEEEQWDQLMEVIKRTENINALERYKAELSKRYPEAVLRCYSEYALGLMHRASERSGYRRAAEVLVLMGKCGVPEGKTQAEKLAEQWRQNYPRRTAMQDELRKKGFLD